MSFKPPEEDEFHPAADIDAEVGDVRQQFDQVQMASDPAFPDVGLGNGMPAILDPGCDALQVQFDAEKTGKPDVERGSLLHGLTQEFRHSFTAEGGFEVVVGLIPQWLIRVVACLASRRKHSPLRL